MLADELLDVLRQRLDEPGLTYAEPPVRLGGGFFTENHAFRLDGTAPPWDPRLVLRLFPTTSPREGPGREAATQSFLADRGFPAPPLRLFDPDARLDGRQYLVMDMLAGRPVISGLSLRRLMSGGRDLARLPETTASIQAELHRIDPEPLLAEVGDASIGVARWFDHLDQPTHREGFGPARQWLRENLPQSHEGPVVCHGDAWGGNILAQDGEVTGLIDWTVVTVADPHLDLGFATMMYSLAPVDAPTAIQRSVARIGRWAASRYLRAYERIGSLSEVDPVAVGYYEALRTAVELVLVAEYRTAEADAVARDQPRPPWDAITADMVGFFRARTGVTIGMPAQPGR